MDKLEEKMREYVELYGIDGINLAIKRHQLASEKRDWFSVRYVSEDAEKERECTQRMAELSSKIEQLDNELERFGITSKNRPTITKTIKKHSPDGWFSGF